MALYAKDPWMIGPEDKAKHEKLFSSLKPVNGKLSGEQSKRYFMKSNLPTPVLGQIWSLADMDRDGRMTVQEFTIAVHLIESKLKGMDLPKVLPQTLKQSTDPNYHGFQSNNNITQTQPMAAPFMMNGMPPPMNPNMGVLQPNMGMVQPNIGMPVAMGMSFPMQPLNRTATLPSTNRHTPVVQQSSQQGPLLPKQSSFDSMGSKPNPNQPVYNYSKTLPINKSAFDSLALDKLTDLGAGSLGGATVGGTGVLKLGDISSPVRLKYTQLFKSADASKTGLLTGEQARNILLQTGVNPQMLIQIWDLSDMNRDGVLECEEFIIAMHLTDVVKLGGTLPSQLPLEVVPHQYKHLVGSTTLAGVNGAEDKTGNVAEATPMAAASFEERRRMNWDKGQQELERRRRELLERQQAEKEAQLQKEREIEEQKRLMREEAEKKRLQEIENERLRREEMEREEERRRKEMVEKQLALQLDAERQRQQEWEKRRKEELLNQKGLEENIVNELRCRLEKLKGNLVDETSNRDKLSNTYEEKKLEGRDIKRQIEQLNKSRELRVQEIQRLQQVLQQSKADLSSVMDEREKLRLELNQTDSTTTSEALGAIRSSVQQMKMGVAMLRGKITTIEQETVQVLHESNEMNKQQKELSDILKVCMEERQRLKEEEERVKVEEEGRYRAHEQQRYQQQQRRKMEAQEKRPENLKKSFEAEMKKRQQQQQQQADVTSKLQTNLLKKQDELVQKQQDALQGSPKIAPSRPRTRPQFSSTSAQLPVLPQPPTSAGRTPSTTEGAFEASFDNMFANDFSPPPLSPSASSGKGKRPPPRPKPPASEKLKEEEARKAAEVERLEREKETIAQLKVEEVEKERRAAEEREKERERLKKEADVKKKVEEMQRKRMEKRNATTLPKSSPEPSLAGVKKKHSMYKMSFAFEPRNPDELSVSEGDMVQVDEDHETPDGWLYGTHNGLSGLFPANYAQKQANNTNDYLDIDDASNALNSALKNQGAAAKPATEQKTSSDLSSVKLKSIPRNESLKKAAPSSPKVAMVPPKGPLKSQIAPLGNTNTGGKVKQSKTNTSSDFNPFPSYDIVPSQSQPQAGNEESIYGNIETIRAGNVSDAVDASEFCQAVALYRYQAQKEDHLSFEKDDQISVQQKQDQWWYGECQGRGGWFPKSYVEVVEGAAPKSLSPEPQWENTAGGGGVEDPAVAQPIEECEALFDYMSATDGDLSFTSGDVITVISKKGEWWEGTLNGTSGMFPANYVKLKEQEEMVATRKPEVVVVTAPYTAGGDGEISLKVGQLVHVMQKEGEWWQGELQVRGKSRPTGWFPYNHVKLMAKGKGDGDTLKRSGKGKSGEGTLKKTQVPDHHKSLEDIYSAPQINKKDSGAVLALYSYTAQNEDELTFCKGTVINVLSKEGGDWWRGEVNGAEGVFPFNYVQQLQGGEQNQQTNQWTGSFESSLLKSMSKSERQRQNHIYELIKTEEDYVSDLSLTLEVFYNPMAESKVLSEAELHTVFINWKELIMCNMKFLKALLVRKKMSRTDKIEGIGDVLIEQLPRFSPYIRFCSCMLKACRLLQDKVEKEPEFKAFEKKCAGDSRLKQNLPLSSYLLKPLQRVTKYPLIISGILKHTPEDYFDRENLMIAFEKAEELCAEINEAVRSQESSNRLEWLQERVNLEGLEEKLTFNSQTNCLGQRKYIFHGTLHKHKSNKELQAFIFNDFLLLCRPHSSQLLTKTNSTMFHPDNDTKYTIYKKPIFLNEVLVKSAQDPDVNETLFHVTHIDRVYSFRAESKNMRNTWVTQIQEASQHFIETEREKRCRATRARSMGDTEERLVVTIIEGADLQASDPNGASDPYCEASMGSQEHRTKVIPNCLNPKWNSTMVFHVKDRDKDVLCISVFDRDFFSPNDFLGRTEVTVSSIMEKGKGPITQRLLLHEVEKGEIVVTLELQNMRNT